MHKNRARTRVVKIIYNIMTKKEALEGLQRVREQINAYRDDGIRQIDNLYDALLEKFGVFLIEDILHLKNREEYKDDFLKTADEFMKEVDEKEKQIKAGELDEVFEKE